MLLEKSAAPTDYAFSHRLGCAATSSEVSTAPPW